MPTPSRRDFLLGAAAIAAVTPFASCSTGASSRRPSANGRLRIAQIGCGGKGLSDLQAAAKNHDVVALCDVDLGKAANARNEHPKAAFYEDYRDLFDKEKVDAVLISTPDHSHAVPALIAMQLGCHVFVQKPLTHTVEEARLLLEASRRHKVITSMGNQGTCMDGFRSAVEFVRSGAIGQVSEVHVWTNRPVWPQGIGRPAHIDAIPASLRWDLWLGPAAYRPYAGPRPDQGFKGYAPFHWRGFWDFGTGALGDMACHVANLPFYALELGAPSWVEADGEGHNDETGPKASTIRFGFAATKQRGPVTLHWYDGGRVPPASVLPSDEDRKGLRKLQEGGFLLVGDKGKLFSPTDYGEHFALYPKAQFANVAAPAPSLPRSPGIHEEWLEGILENRQPMANFEYAAPFTEAILLGNVALRLGQRIEWDSQRLRATNAPDAERFIKKDYRRGFELIRG
jgi:predicted dehydrogenase